MSFLPPITDLDHDTNKANMKVFKDHVAAGKPAFLFLYLDFCGPCNMTKESWKDIHKFTNAEQLKKNDVIVAQINQSLFKEMENIGAEPNSFPTIRYIGKNGKIIEEYESARTPEAFAQWIESKIVKESSKSHHKKRVHHKKSMKGGKKWSAKYKRTINCKSPKGFSQRQYCKYGRKKNHTKKIR